MNASAWDLAGVRAGLLLIPAALGAISYLLMKAWKGMRRAVHLSDAILKILPLLDEMKTQIRAIDKELHPNGGSSMRDQIVQIKTEVGVVKQMASDAKDKAADAASEAEGLSGALARFHSDSRARADVAGRERRGVQESLDVLLRSLAEYAAEGNQKERAYVAALKRLGIDLTNVTAELDGEGPGDDR